MSEYDEEYEDFYYDDGRFADDGEVDENEEYEDYGIPTYDDLDLEGRYYCYGSRQEYNAWRYEQIQALRESSVQTPVYQYYQPYEEPEKETVKKHKKAATKKKTAKRYKEIPTYRELSTEEKARYSCREEYNKWRNSIIRKKKKELLEKKKMRMSMMNMRMSMEKKKADEESAKKTIRMICALVIVIILFILFYITLNL